MSDSDGDMFWTQSKYTQQVEDDVSEFSFRFGEPLTEDSIKERMKSTLSKSTQSKNRWALSIFKRWQDERAKRSISENLHLPPVCLTKSLFDMTANEMNTSLKYFFFEVRKKDGSHYPSSSLYGIFAAFASALKAVGSEFNIFEDCEFKEAIRSLDVAMKERSAGGQGASSRKEAEIISFEEENELWTKGVLGDDSPQKLLDTVLYLTGLNFALQGGREHRSLRMFKNPQITGPHTDGKGRRYVRYVEDVSKTNPGGINQRQVKVKDVRAYENIDRPERCYVRLYEKYVSLCPKTCSDSSRDAFYLTPLKKQRENQWFFSMPFGHNTLQGTVKRVCAACGISGHKTNHSLRATAATRLYQANVGEQTISEQTGHRSDAVRIYKRTSDDQKAVVSEVLSKTRKCTSTITNPDETDVFSEPKLGQRVVSFTFNFS